MRADTLKVLEIQTRPSLNDGSTSAPLAAASNACRDIPFQDIYISKTTNQIAGFNIDLSKKLPYYNSSEQTTVYHASHAQSPEEGWQAVVFENLEAATRLNEALLLSKQKIPGLITPRVVGLVPLTGCLKNNLVMIFPTPPGISLSTLIRQEAHLTDDFILEKLACQVSKTLSELHKIGIVHGSLSPETIFIDRQQQITINECLSTLCGASQPTFYETPHRAQSHIYAKDSEDFTADYYSLGMVLFSVYSKYNDLSATNSKIIQQKLHGGTYHFLSQICLITGRLNDIIRGLIQDGSSTRWQHTNMLKAIDSRSAQLDRAGTEHLFSRPLKFAEENHYSCASLALAMYLNWDAAIKLVETDKIQQWLLSYNIDISERLSFIDLLVSNFEASAHQYRITSADLKLSCIITLLDPKGPIRLKYLLSFYLSALGNLLAFFTQSHSPYSQVILDFINQNTFEIFEKLYNSLGIKQFANDFSLLRLSKKYLSDNSLGFGNRRCLYELTPSLPCLTFLPGNQLIWTLEDAVLQIEASNWSVLELIKKPDLMAFIASRLKLNETLDMEVFKHFPILRANDGLKILVLLVYAQRKTAIKKLPAICQKFGHYLQELFLPMLRNNYLKDKIKNAIQNSSKYGICEYLLRISMRTQYLEKDQEKYQQALILHKKLITQYNLYKAQYENNNAAYSKGLRLALWMAYAVCITAMIMLITQIMTI